MGKLILLAKISSIVGGVAISLFLASLLLPHSREHHLPSLPQYSWITSQLIIFVIFKLSTAKNSANNGASDHSPPTTAAESDSPDPYDDVPSSADCPTEEPVSPDTDTIVEERGEAPRRLRKSNTWEGYSRRVAEAEAEAAVVLRRLRKWETFKKKATKVEAEDAGLSRREELVAGKDELFQRAETFIKKQYDELRLQQQQEALRSALP